MPLLSTNRRPHPGEPPSRRRDRKGSFDRTRRAARGSSRERSVPYDGRERGRGRDSLPRGRRAVVFWLLAPDGTVRYVGGYTDRKQGLDAKDLAIVADTRAGQDVAPLPIFGCAVSARLRAALNPLGMP